jgi:rubrerythrin
VDIERFDLEDLLLAAIKSEVESERIYSDIAKRVKNAFLKERMEFLANEERGHKKTLENIYHMNFGDKEIVLPEKTDVPLPEVIISNENDPLSMILEKAMEAEKASEDFYRSLAERFEDEKIKNMLIILAEMELTHYYLLEKEYENLKRFEDYDAVWPMMHAGP